MSRSRDHGSSGVDFTSRPSSAYLGDTYFDTTLQQLFKYTSYGWFPVDVYPTSAVAGGLLASDATYYYRVFTSTGYLHVGTNLTADILVIGGGGGGGETIAGGGGAGGVTLFSSQSLTPTSYLATVGLGGAGGYDGNNGNYPSGQNGQSSQFGSLTAVAGGGAGGGYSLSGGNGASGGGSGSSSSTAGTASNGFAGGSAAGNGNYGPGGGGSGAVGGNSSGSAAGNGGNGTTNYSSWLTAINPIMSFIPGWSAATVNGTYIAGGGGGGLRNTATQIPGTGGFGGGGQGGFGVSNITAGPGSGNNYIVLGGTPGIPNTGSGGGGGGYNNTSSIEGAGGNGGSGLIIVRYTRAQVGG